MASSALLRIPPKATFESPTAPPLGDTFALASHSSNPGCSRSGSSHSKNNIPLIDVGNYMATLHSLPVSHKHLHLPLMRIFLNGMRIARASAPLLQVAYAGNSFVCISKSPSLGPWVLDFGASDHIFGNRSLFSSLSTYGFLPSITSTNGSHNNPKELLLPIPSLP
ncbi:hypothetical protein CR513_55465, partial [Mucuna pruriens]